MNGDNGVFVEFNGQTHSYDFGAVTEVNVATAEGMNDEVDVVETPVECPRVHPRRRHRPRRDWQHLDGVQGINGSVSVYSSDTTSTSLVIDDSADDLAARIVTMNSGGVFGLAPAPITYDQFRLNSLVVDAGGSDDGFDTFNVLGTPNSPVFAVPPPPSSTKATADFDDGHTSKAPTANLTSTAAPARICLRG